MYEAASVSGIVNTQWHGVRLKAIRKIGSKHNRQHCFTQSGADINMRRILQQYERYRKILVVPGSRSSVVGAYGL